MDEINTITPFQSETIKAAVKCIAVNAATLITLATGKAFDVDAINAALDQGAGLVINAISMYYAWKAYRGRMNATATIIKKE